MGCSQLLQIGVLEGPRKKLRSPRTSLMLCSPQARTLYTVFIKKNVLIQKLYIVTSQSKNTINDTRIDVIAISTLLAY